MRGEGPPGFGDRGVREHALRVPSRPRRRLERAEPRGTSAARVGGGGTFPS